MTIRDELICGLEQVTDFGVRGFIGVDDRVYPLGSDTKVISTLFEVYVRPMLLDIAKKHGRTLQEAKQTVYPDFTLHSGQDDKAKIAIDVKTTYRRPSIFYTLGSYTSFLRNGTKNILYPYSHYSKHWIVGFVYDRVDTGCLPSYSFANRNAAVSPIKNVEWFVQEKFKIAGELPGSGNTANIGSIRTRDISDFQEGRGPFAQHGEEVFRDYWANFEKSTSSRPYATIADYLRWKAR